MFKKPQKYEEAAFLQKRIAAKLLSFIQNDFAKYGLILDIGCGSGFIAKEIPLTDKQEIHAIDLSTEMLEYSKAFYDKLFCMDAEHFTLPYKYDLIVSSMCLQWVKNIEDAINNILKHLKSEGDFYFAIPLEESLLEIKNCFLAENLKPPILPFKSPIKLKPFYIDEYQESFKSLTSALKHFNIIDAKLANTPKITHNQFKKLEEHFQKQITWRIGFFKISTF